MASKLERPAALKSGSRIGLVAPAGPLLQPDDLDRAIGHCTGMGFEPVVGRHVKERHGYLAGTDEQRLEDLNAFLADPSLDAVWCLRGGYGTPRLLHRIDYASLAQHPKVVLGYSDITGLLNAITRRTGLITFHGPVARAELPPFSRDALLRVTTLSQAAGVLPLPCANDDDRAPEAGVTTLRSGTVDGPLYGGNLSLLNVLVGTPYMPNLEGALLFLEEVSEKIYAVDRLLAHLGLAGILERLGGIIIGQFSDLIRETSTGILEFEEVVETHLGHLGIPAAVGFPIGHGRNNWTLPLGVTARLDADAGTLELLEPAVS